MRDLIATIRGQERRNAAGVPLRFQIIDALGVGLGSWFILESIRRTKPNWINVGLGSVMVFIHLERFIYAPQVKMLMEERSNGDRTVFKQPPPEAPPQEKAKGWSAAEDAQEFEPRRSE